jgi:hypothetical protein
MKIRLTTAKWTDTSAHRTVRRFDFQTSMQARLINFELFFA